MNFIADDFLAEAYKKETGKDADYDEDDRNVIKTYNITVFQPCGDAVYIRWLNSSGYYSYWAFSPYPYRSVSGSKLGSVINSFPEMALAQSRNLPVGYRDSFSRIDVIASAVPIVFRRKLMDLFTSPAVYLWREKEILNLISAWTNEGYETLETDGTVITSAINTANNGFAISELPYFKTSSGEIIIAVLSLTLNSGAAPNIRIVNGDTGAVVSNVVTLVEGLNKIELTITTAPPTAKVQIYSTTASNFSTSEVIIKRKEVDWILLDRVEGSHNLREKMDFDNFECALVLPENYTQTLSGQNL